MQGQIIDTDLVNTNIKNWVELFGVIWNYTNMNLDSRLYALWWAALSWNTWWTWSTIARWALRFYDDWTKIIIMGSSEIQSLTSFSNHWLAWYYAEITKSTGVLVVYPFLQHDWWTTTNFWSTKMVYTNIWWTNRYWFTRTNDVWSTCYFYFNWSIVVQWWESEILSAWNIWSTSISYRWRTLQAWPLRSTEEVTFYGFWWSCLQTLQYT